MTHPQTQDDEALVEVMARAMAQVDHNGRVAEEGYWANPDTGSFHYRNAATAALTALRNHEGRE